MNTMNLSKNKNSNTNTLKLDELILLNKNSSSNNNVIHKVGHYPPANKEWFNSVYLYNKNYIKSLPITDKVINNLLNSYFNLTSSLEKYKIKARNRRIRFKRLSNNRIFLSRAEMKHTNNKVVITLYTYNRTLFCNGFSIIRKKIKLGKNIHLLKKSFFIGIAKVTKKLMFTKVFTNIINPFDSLENKKSKKLKRFYLYRNKIRNFSMLIKLRDLIKSLKIVIFNKRILNNSLIININHIISSSMAGLRLNKQNSIFNSFKVKMKLHRLIFYVYYYFYKNNLFINNFNKFEKLRNLKKLILIKWYEFKSSLTDNKLNLFRTSIRLRWNNFKEWKILGREDFINLSKKRRVRVLEYKKLNKSEKSKLKNFEEFKSSIIQKWFDIKKSHYLLPSNQNGDTSPLQKFKINSLKRFFIFKLYTLNIMKKKGIRYVSKVLYLLKRYNKNFFNHYNKFNLKNKWTQNYANLNNNFKLNKTIISKSRRNTSVLATNNKLNNKKNNILHKENNMFKKSLMATPLNKNMVNNITINTKTTMSLYGATLYNENSLNIKRWIYKNRHLFRIKKSILAKSVEQSIIRKKPVFRKIEIFKLKKWLFKKNIFIFKLFNLNKSLFNPKNLKLPVFYFYRNWHRKFLPKNNKKMRKFRYKFIYRIARTLRQLFYLKGNNQNLLHPSKYDIVFFNYLKNVNTLNNFNNNKLYSSFGNIQFYNNLTYYTNFYKENLLQQISEKSMLEVQSNKLINKRLNNIITLYIYYVKMIYIHNYKYKNWFLLGLKNIISNIYKKKVEFNIINLKYIHLSSDILSNSMAVKLRDRKKRILRVMKKALKLIKMPSLRYFIRTKNLKELHLDNYKTLSVKPTLKKSILNYILRYLNSKKISGVRLEGKGRLTKRLTASRSMFKVKYKGSLKNIESSFKQQSSVMLRGHMKSNLQYTQISSKTRNGAFGLKTWISNC